MHIQLDNGRWLVGPGATQTADKPGVPFAGMSAAMAAVERYRLVLRVFCGREAQGVTLHHNVKV